MKVPVLILCILVVQCYSVPINKFSWPWKNADEASQTSEPTATKKQDAVKPAENPEKAGVNPVLTSRRRRQADAQDVPAVASEPASADTSSTVKTVATQQEDTQGTLAAHSDTQSAQLAVKQDYQQQAQPQPKVQEQAPVVSSVHQTTISRESSTATELKANAESQLQPILNPSVNEIQKNDPVDADDELRSALPRNPVELLGSALTVAHEVSNAMTFVETCRQWLHSLAVMAGICQGP